MDLYVGHSYIFVDHKMSSIPVGGFHRDLAAFIFPAEFSRYNALNLSKPLIIDFHDSSLPPYRLVSAISPLS